MLPAMPDRFLVTGGLGCIGAWVAHELLAEGSEVVIGDLGASDHRLRNLVGAQPEGLIREPLDITDPAGVMDCFARHRPTHVIHLAALQVPFCKADPVLGARVNVVGTICLLEAMAEHLPDRTFAYASSVAAYGGEDEPTVDGEAAADPQGKPRTLYGVYKRANEESALVYHADRGVSSIGMRPYIVYGLGRDQGVTSSPTSAMLAAAKGEAFHIPFGGRAVYQHGRDAARAFIAAARADFDGSTVVNLPGDTVSMTEIIAAIHAEAPDAEITLDDVQLPFPPSVDTSDFDRVVGAIGRYDLAAGVADTMARFRALLADGATIVPER
jgi:UDP-glucuronate 4-epimerase